MQAIIEQAGFDSGEFMQINLGLMFSKAQTFTPIPVGRYQLSVFELKLFYSELSDDLQFTREANRIRPSTFLDELGGGSSGSSSGTSTVKSAKNKQKFPIDTPSWKPSEEEAPKVQISYEDRPESRSAFMKWCLRFIKHYYAELRAVICPAKAAAMNASKSTATVITASLSTYLANHFHLDSAIAAAVAAGILVVIFQCTKGAFCKMTKEEYETVLTKGRTPSVIGEEAPAKETSPPAVKAPAKKRAARKSKPLDES